MSDENVALVRRIFDNLDHPSDEVRALWAPDVEFDVSRDLFGPLVGGGHYRGPEGVREWMLDFYGAWGRMELTCEELIDAGDDVVVVLHVHGRGRTSGIEVEYNPAGVWTVRDGRIVKVVWYAGRDEALASAGHLGTVLRFLDAARRDDLEGVLECLHPDLEFVPLRVSTEGAFRGHEGFERFREDTWEHYDMFEPRYELRDLGEHGVLVWGVICVRGKGSGLELEVPSAGIFEFRDGLIVRWQDFVSRERALEEAGLPRSA